MLHLWDHLSRIPTVCWGTWIAFCGSHLKPQQFITKPNYVSGASECQLTMLVIEILLGAAKVPSGVLFTFACDCYSIISFLPNQDLRVQVEITLWNCSGLYRLCGWMCVHIKQMFVLMGPSTKHVPACSSHVFFLLVSMSELSVASQPMSLEWRNVT